MSNPNYKKSILVSANAATAFDAVTSGVEHWWTSPDRPLQKIGDRAKFSFPPGVSYWTFELTDMDRQSRAEWSCVDALHVHKGQPKAIETEWLGTKVNWNIKTDPEGTTIELEHVGLSPQLLCYEICEAGWDVFFLGSLKQYLETGKGTPHQG